MNHKLVLLLLLGAGVALVQSNPLKIQDDTLGGDDILDGDNRVMGDGDMGPHGSLGPDGKS